MLSRREFLLFAGAFLAGCAGAPPRRISGELKPLDVPEENLFATYAGIHRYDVYTDVLGNIGTAKFYIAPQPNTPDRFQIGFSMDIDNFIAQLLAFDEIKQTTTAYEKHSKLHPVSFHSGIEFLSGSDNDSYHYGKELKRGTEVIKSTAEQRKDVYDPLCFIANALSTTQTFVAANVIDGKFRLGYAIGKDSVVELFATYTNESLTFHFNENIIKGGGDFRFFYENGRISDKRIEIDKGGVTTTLVKR